MQIVRKALSAVIVASLVLTASAYGHVLITPRESEAGAVQRYTMSVPTERDSPTVRLEVTFPSEITVTSVAETSGWKVEQRKDSQGRIVGAVWSGGSIAFADRAEFVFEAKNPASEAKLEFKVIQTYADDVRSEWTGGEGSRTPNPTVAVKKAPGQ